MKRSNLEFLKTPTLSSVAHQARILELKQRTNLQVYKNYKLRFKFSSFPSFYFHISVTVKYEKCPINVGKGFDKSSGRFVAKEPGSYDFSATFLMKADQSGSVIVSLKKGKVSGTNTCLHMSLLLSTMQGF